jgi:3-oxoacyl-[acyl-carrier protein] reductase
MASGNTRQDEVKDRSLHALLDLGGRLAVVTGAAQGFGAAISLRLAEAGAMVVVADINPEGATTTTELIRAAGGRAEPRVVDVGDARAVEQLFNSISGAPDILVNNAGVFSNYFADKLPAAEFDRIMRVNVGGAFYCAAAFVRAARAAVKSGVIVNVASVDAIHPSAEGLLHYTTSKHAIGGLTRSLAMEVAPHRIRVNAVCPGASMTEGAVALVTSGAPTGIDVAAQWNGIRDRTPLGRLCDPDDVARAVVFLASDLAEFITGILLPVDGGILVQPLEGYVPARVESAR